MPEGPAYRIETERLVIRCFEPRDAPALDAALRISLDHLRPWMGWAHEEPRSIPDRVRLLRSLRAQFDSDADFHYAVLDRDESELLGGVGSHTRQGKGIREIGYWIRADRVRRGYASESASAIAKIAFEVERVRRVEIRCDPENVASARIPKKLGFQREGVLRLQIDNAGTARDAEVWSLIAADYAVSPARSLPVRAFGAAGQILLA